MERQLIFTTGVQRIRRLKAEGKFAEAAEEIRMGLEKDPEDLILKTSLADLYQRQGRLSEGRILAEEVLARDPANPGALSVLGDLHLKGRAPEKAIENPISTRPINIASPVTFMGQLHRWKSSSPGPGY